MKKIASFIFLLGLLSNCNESRESSSDNQFSTFNREVGEQISMETAQRWTERFRQSSEAAKANSVKQLSQASLSQVFNPTNDKLGVSFHRAVDDEGIYHMIAEPVFDGQPVWASQFVVDANSDALITSETAKRWANRYKNENPNGIWSHFFGAHVFEKSFSFIEIVESLNDQNSLALLLHVWRQYSDDDGRTNADVVEVFDHGQLCPTNCGSIN